MDSATASPSMRHRVVSVFRYEYLMVLGSMLVYYNLRHLINYRKNVVRYPGPYDSGFDSAARRHGDSSYVLVNLSDKELRRQDDTSRPGATFVLPLPTRRMLHLLMLACLIGAHSSFVLYWCQSRVPIILHWFTSVSLGVWIHICPLIFAVSCWNMFRRLLSFLPRAFKMLIRCIRALPAPLGHLALEWPVQMICVLVLTAALTVIQLVSVVVMPYSIRHERVAFNKHALPESAVNQRIMVMSDIHLGGVITDSHIRKLSLMVSEHMPDALIIAGDLFDGDIKDLGAKLEPFKSMVMPRGGVYFVSGNHEYYYDHISKYEQLVTEQLKWRVLHNKAVDLKGVCIVGVDDWWLRQDLPTSNMSAVYADMFNRSNCAPKSPTITVIHNPAFAVNITSSVLADRTDLVVSGHVHAGQFYILAPIIWYTAPLYYGWYHVANSIQVFVSAGVHFFDVPMKMLGYLEIVIFTLVNTK